MSLEKMEALEVRVKRLVDMVQELREANGLLKQELEGAREGLMRQEMLSQNWEEERSTIRSRIEKVLGELDFLEHSDSELQGVARDEGH